MTPHHGRWVVGQAWLLCPSPCLSLRLVAVVLVRVLVLVREVGLVVLLVSVLRAVDLEVLLVWAVEVVDPPWEVVDPPWEVDVVVSEVRQVVS